MTETDLLTDGLMHLDNALGSIMEMKSVAGKALANILHGALCFGEMLLGEYDD